MLRACSKELPRPWYIKGLRRNMVLVEYGFNTQLNIKSSPNFLSSRHSLRVAAQKPLFWVSASDGGDCMAACMPA
ncbi:hypothetical protein B5X24_HaOG203030 [Helicoverpa armigera]|uniref:Uncharacterized protein n=1 Tax=Helicoverpa armigera TaxID=29058 RepID=A0A2W1BY33_HELAM|nr:hypothetical protein B5X24_HaOG203030 [Helicoverpa armigera]